MDAPDSGWWRDRAACASPDVLPLVDAAYDRPGGAAACELKKRVCPGCPVWTRCLAEAMVNGEFGVWGGTSPNQRTRAGSLSVGRGRVSSPARYGPITV